MGENEIKNKLTEKLKSVPRTEEDVVYILSRVRKLLEIDDKPEKYSILNFYCNLTLHARITRPPRIVIEKLKKIHTGTDYSAFFEITSKNFHDQLDKFLKEHRFSSFYPIDPEDLKKLNSLLIDIWSNTPIRIEYIKAFNIFFDKNADGDIIILRELVK